MAAPAYGAMYWNGAGDDAGVETTVVLPEEAEGAIAVRLRTGHDLGAIKVEEFIDIVLPRIASHSLYLSDVDEAEA